MRKTLLLVFLHASVLLAQTPALSGVWRADLQKTKLPGPPVKQYLAIIEQKEIVLDRRTGEKGPALEETTGVWGEHGEERSELTFLTNGKPLVRPYEGVPTRGTASAEGNTLTVTLETAGRPVVTTRKYELSADGQTLTLTSVTKAEGHDRQSTVVLLKQPQSAAEPLLKPQELAEAHFKNVKTALKSLPTSEFIDNMRYFSWSLNKDCEFCHVKGHFDSDDKKEKKTARQMIDMTNAIDRDNFKDRPEVRCFTCHEFHEHPLSRPMFAGEVEEHHHEDSKPGAQPPPPPPGN